MQKWVIEDVHIDMEHITYTIEDDRDITKAVEGILAEIGDDTQLHDISSGSVFTDGEIQVIADEYTGPFIYVTSNHTLIVYPGGKGQKTKCDVHVIY